MAKEKVEHNHVADPIKHKYIEKYPIKDFINPEKESFLILGTAYPCNCNQNAGTKPTERFMCDFFYGNDYTIWEILRLTELVKFPEKEHVKLSHDNNENKESTYANEIIEILKHNNVAVSDVFSKFQRIEGNSCTSDKFNIANCDFNTSIMETIKNTKKLNTIFFTSDKTRTLFTQYIYNKYLHDNNIRNIPLRLPILNENGITIKLGDLRVGSIFYSNPSNSFFKRDIKFIILPSPSNRNQIMTRIEKVTFYKNAFEGVFTNTSTN